MGMDNASWSRGTPLSWGYELGIIRTIGEIGGATVVDRRYLW